MKKQNWFGKIIGLVWLMVLGLGGFCASLLAQESSSISAGGGSSSVGQSMVDLPQITSKHLLTLEAFRQASRVGGSVSARLPRSENDGPSRYEAFLGLEQRNSIGISNAIRTLSLDVEVINPKDPLFTRAYVKNDDGDEVFSGWKQFYLIPSSGKDDYILPPDYGNVELELNNVPIYIKDASQGYFIPLREDGSTDDNNVQKIWTENGKVHYPWYFAGQNGIFAVYIEKKGGGYFEFWNIRSGANLKGVSYPINIKATVKGVQVFVDQDVDVVIPTIKGRGRPIMVELHQSTTAIRKISFRTSEKGSGWWFSGLWIVDKAGMRTPYVPEEGLGNNVLVGLTLGPGVYHLIAIFGEDQLIDIDQPMIPIEVIPVTPPIEEQPQG